MLIDSDVKLLFGKGGIGRDVIRELDHFDVKALLLSNFSGLRHDVGMRSCGHSNLDGLKLRSLGSCGAAAGACAAACFSGSALLQAVRIGAALRATPRANADLRKVRFCMVNYSCR